MRVDPSPFERREQRIGQTVIGAVVLAGLVGLYALVATDDERASQVMEGDAALAAEYARGEAAARAELVPRIARAYAQGKRDAGELVCAPSAGGLRR